jgi:sec-independent protein translocase protein TatB
MFNVGGPEIMVVILVALVVLGPDQLPKAMRTFGNVMAQVRKVSNGFQDEMRSAMHSLEQPTSSSSASSPSVSPSSSPSSSGAGTANGTASPEPVVSESTPPAPVVDPVADRPGASAADRAAG